MSILTSVQAATQTSLLTVDDLAAALQIDPQDLATIDMLTSLGARISSVIAAHCRMPQVGLSRPTMFVETIKETWRGTLSVDRLVLAKRPVTAIVQISCHGVDMVVADESELDAAAAILYRLDEDRRRRWAPGKIEVTYSAGWDPLPEDLKLAASKLAAEIYSEQRRGDPNLKRRTVEGIGSREWWVGPATDPAISADVVDLLSPFMNDCD